MSRSRVQDKDQGWKRIKREARKLDNAAQDVGVFGDRYQDGQNVAQVAAIQERRTRFMSRATAENPPNGAAVADAVHKGRDGQKVALAEAEKLAAAMRKKAPADSGKLRRSIAVREDESS